MVDPVMYASVDSKNRTPHVIFDPLHEEFRFEVDMAASAADALLDTYVAQDVDALALPDWGAMRCWLNPPWGRKVFPKLGAWVKRARVEASERGALVAMLLPGRVDTIWWHDEVMPWARVRIVRGRVTFDKSDGSGPQRHPAPFPVAIAIFRPGCTMLSTPQIESWDPLRRKR